MTNTGRPIYVRYGNEIKVPWFVILSSHQSFWQLLMLYFRNFYYFILKIKKNNNCLKYHMNLLIFIFYKEIKYV